MARPNGTIGWENGALVPIARPRSGSSPARSHLPPPWAEALRHHLHAQVAPTVIRPRSWGGWGAILDGGWLDVARSQCQATGRIYLLATFHDRRGWTGRVRLVYPEPSGARTRGHRRLLQWRVRTRTWDLSRQLPWHTSRDAAWIHEAMAQHIRELLAKEGPHAHLGA